MRVVKIGGRAQSDPRIAAALCHAWKSSPNNLCVVHGGGDEISSMQRALGIETTFVGGRRFTSRSDLDLLRMVLSGVVNKRLVNSLVTAGVPAVGLSGEDDALISAELIDAASLGFAGRPTAINVQLLCVLMDAGYVPVISPVGYDATSGEGGALNVNGDDAAAAVAAALEAEELLLIADIEGVRDAQGDLAPFLSIEAALELISSGVAAGGMAAKLESAHAALLAGVDRVRICDLAGLADSERGTFITQSQGVVS
ncbi:MAG TPA: acetylglutamate kinase [Gemmatimonadaceae bacterium]|nr:acetylglutamate kinase [Gemmatimonadaceae bacterium]